MRPLPDGHRELMKIYSEMKKEDREKLLGIARLIRPSTKPMDRHERSFIFA